MHAKRMKTCVAFVSCAALGLFFSACTDTPPPVVKPIQKVESKPIIKKPTPQPKVTAPVTVVKPGALTSIDMGRLFSMSQTGKTLLIDVRPPLYYRLGHIDGAESLPLIRYDKLIDSKRPMLDAAVKANKIIVLYCQNVNCPDAHKLGTKLIKLGYSVSVYRGGWEEWREAGL